MVRATAKTTVRGQDKVKKRFKDASELIKAYVTIGLHDPGKRYPDGGPEVFDVMMWNEFGTRNIPQRSFLRSTIAENEALIDSWRMEALENILEKNWSIKKALGEMGQKIVLLIQKKIRSNVPPPLADSTKKRKQRENKPPVTLIDTGLMLAQVTYKVRYK